MSDQIKNMFIGIFVIAAISITILIILFLEPTVGDGKRVYQVRFSNIAGINIGTRVTVAGKPVGEVLSITEIPNAREQRTDELGRVYFYQLQLKVDSSVDVYNTDEIAIQTTGLLGEKSISIIPKAPIKGQDSKKISDKVIYAQSVEPLENALYQFGEVSEKIEVAVSDFNQWFVENHEELTQSVKSFADALGEINTFVGTVNKENITADTKQALLSFDHTCSSINTSVKEVIDNKMVAKCNEIIENISTGKGSIGKFIKSDDFYLRTTCLMGKIDTLMNDLNHYGLLFQYDKGWQRIRTKKANLLTALKTPNEFKRYFETEVDSITTSLERLTMLLEKAQNSQQKEKIISSVPFKKDFATLLREVEDLMDSLKLYNEDVVNTLQD